MSRELKLVYRDRFNLYSRTFQITYLAFLSATLFVKAGYDSVAQGQLFLLEIFFASLVSIFAGFGKVSESSLLSVRSGELSIQLLRFQGEFCWS